MGGRERRRAHHGGVHPGADTTTEALRRRTVRALLNGVGEVQVQSVSNRQQKYRYRSQPPIPYSVADTDQAIRVKQRHRPASAHSSGTRAGWRLPAPPRPGWLRRRGGGEWTRRRRATPRTCRRRQGCALSHTMRCADTSGQLSPQNRKTRAVDPRLSRGVCDARQADTAPRIDAANWRSRCHRNVSRGPALDSFA